MFYTFTSVLAEVCVQIIIIIVVVVIVVVVVDAALSVFSVSVERMKRLQQ
jgi:hypothetical protein